MCSYICFSETHYMHFIYIYIHPSKGPCLNSASVASAAFEAKQADYNWHNHDSWARWFDKC